MSIHETMKELAQYLRMQEEIAERIAKITNTDLEKER